MRKPSEPYGGIVDTLAQGSQFNSSGPAEPEAHPPKGKSCLAFSEAEDAAFAFIENDMRTHLRGYGLREAEDFVLETDAAGNLYVTYFGEDRGTTVLYHSHVDSVPDGGSLDGVWGVDIARDLLLKLAEFRTNTDAKTKNSVTMVVWRAEESSMTGRACVGSAIATGELTPEKLNAMHYGKNGNENTLQEHWERYAQQGKSWEDVVQLAANPIIRDDGTGTGMLELELPSGLKKIALAEEGHIAQSLLQQVTGNNVHIAEGGIGGSIREDLVIDPEHITTHSHEVGAGTHKIIEIEVVGQEAHTGGTVHNLNEKKSQGGLWFRRDALVGSYVLFRELFGKGDENAGVHVLSVEPDELTGYTKVPRRMNIRLLVSSQHANDFCTGTLEACSRTLRDSKDLDMRWNIQDADNGTQTSIDKKQAVSLLSIPARMEGAARKTDTHENAPRVVFAVTSTGADFVLTPAHGFSMKMDFRFTDTAHLNRLRQHMADEVQERVFNRSFPAMSFAEHRTERSRAASGTVSTMVAEQKMEIARCLGYSALRAPVLPGHDSNTLAKAKRGPADSGTHISMTMARDNGTSHNPHESAEESDLRAAQLLSQETVVHWLELQGEGIADRFLGVLQRQRQHREPVAL
ncbi:hypothetical protein COU78_05690 [Candidatus Peregrinibacteria bacterium CG10_big_fil_rev_8_21_14_0_10_49_24]|nr:MAG: hypothetical protein COV83_03475 [Candidatus Peregrinibacteria bacterium CG11_big_fil_rev_8_21_14_0_20_49_14]PIR50618.1 MAG: hypothetical protein COU78_05690 [Candidatus Peregrinibacteria bacterium CG10_big_fil_rev_8_21_14_0_10_49_24]PJA67064.1 MAG: hypothetical protein CO157_06415 [Candidatus Peregrinibacteria bacterium CG_4_9_14_3_um_filter_49_12]